MELARAIRLDLQVVEQDLRDIVSSGFGTSPRERRLHQAIEESLPELERVLVRLRQV